VAIQYFIAYAQVNSVTKRFSFLKKKMCLDETLPCVLCFVKAVELFPLWINHQNRFGNTPLHTLAQNVKFPLSRAEILATHGANFEMRNNEHKTPKEVAISESGPR
jgi:hypothetical protein